MKNIIVVGAGQLGSRHLQAISQINEGLSIYVVDPSDDSLAISKERFEQVSKGSHKINYVNNFDAVESSEIFFAVVATNSNVRYSVFSNLLEKFQVKNILLEKILFNKKEDYTNALNLLKNHTGTNVWVNCCMRMQEVYENMKAEVSGKPIEYKVSGSNFGLVTNYIHYLDHFCFLISSNKFTMDTSFLEKKVYESKRPGYQELNGRLKSALGESTLSVNCFTEGELPVLIEILTPQNRYVFKENEDKFYVSNKENSWKWEENDLNFKYQSNLTNIVLQNIIDGKNVSLPTLEESVEIHLGMLEPLSACLKELGFDSKVEFPFT